MGKIVSNGQINWEYKTKAIIYIGSNLLLLKWNYLKIGNKAYWKCFQCIIKL